MYFLGSLGIDIWILLAQVVNFLLLMWLLTKLVYKPLLHRIEKDEVALRQTKEAEETLIEKEKQFETKQKSYEKRIKNKARAIVAEAEEIAEEIRTEAKVEVEAEKKAVRAQIQERLSEINHD